MRKGATRVQSTNQRQVNIGKWIKPISVTVTVFSVMAAISILVLQIANKDVNSLQLEGDLTYIDRSLLNTSLQGLFPAGFISMDVERIRETVESLPMVDRAQVEKKWSGVLFINIDEEVPVALWNGNKLLSQRGEILPVEMGDLDLPMLVSSDQDSRKVMEHFLLFNRWAKRHGLELIKLSRTASGWQLIHDNELTIWLDGASAMKGLRQLESVFHLIKLERISRIDMRYEQGFAVAWKHGQAQVQG